MKSAKSFGYVTATPYNHLESGSNCPFPDETIGPREVKQLAQHFTANKGGLELPPLPPRAFIIIYTPK